MDTSLHAQDILIALKWAVLREDESHSLRELSAATGVSKSAVAVSLKRLAALKLLRPEGQGLRLNRLALRQCVEHALQWLAPAKVGPIRRGFPTAHSAPALVHALRGGDDLLVIPYRGGPARGCAVSPLHPQAPFAAAHDERMQALLALADAFRVGRARDRAVAAQLIAGYI